MDESPEEPVRDTLFLLHLFGENEDKVTWSTVQLVHQVLMQQDRLAVLMERYVNALIGTAGPGMSLLATTPHQRKTALMQVHVDTMMEDVSLYGDAGPSSIPKASVRDWKIRRRLARTLQEDPLVPNEYQGFLAVSLAIYDDPLKVEFLSKEFLDYLDLINDLRGQLK